MVAFSVLPEASTAGDLGRQLERNTLLFEDALELAADFVVHAGQDAVEEFDHQHLRAEPPPDGPEFETDDAGADDQELAGDLVESERAGRGHDALLVDRRCP